MSTDRYDRQNRVYGIDGTKKIQNSKVALFGQKCDVMFEVAKNLVLGGVNELFIIEENISHSTVLNDNFTIKKQNDSTFEILLNNDIPFLGNVHNNSYQRLSKEISALNPYCQVNIIQSSDYCKDNNIIMIFINYDPLDVIEFNINLHNQNKFIVLNVYDLQFEIINDFGEHTIYDDDGETYDIFTLIKFDIDTNNEKVTVQTIGNHNLSNNDDVKFNIYQNQFNLVIDKIINMNTFECKITNDIKNINFTNGYVQRLKKSVVLNHKELTNFYYLTKIDSLIQIKNVNPVLQSFIGAIIASECNKAITNKYIPFDQTYTFDYNNELFYRPNEDILDKLSKLKYLIIGSGAIGCELLKNLAMIGVTDISITDPDHIEVSNLSRQFLFRNDNIGSSKSLVAGKRITEYNQNINIKSYQDKLSQDNQQFVETHFPKHDIIFNALDNLQARLYVDSNAIKFNKPLFESGTQGTKGNTQPIIPHLTESYGASQDTPLENNFAVCTIKNFPTLIQHTIHYAMDDFNGLFCKQPEYLNTFLHNTQQFNKVSDIELNIIKLFLHRIITKLNNIINANDYIIWAYQLWHDRFNRRVIHLLKTYPSNKIMEDGSKFWSNGKRCPTLYDYNTQEFNDYIYATTHLLINTYHINIIDYSDIDNLIKNMDYTNISVCEYIDDPDYYDDQSHNKELPTDKLNNDISIHPQEFEKDLDTNYHIAYINATSNNRALIYDIPRASFYETKGIAGKIIPALATTTAIVSSLIVIEMMKYVMSYNKIDDYQSYFINIANNLFILGEPLPPKITKINGLTFTEWDKFEYNVDYSLEDLKNIIGKQFNTTINMITIGTTILYADFNNTDTSTLLIDALKNTGQIKSKKIELFVGSENDELELPQITINI